MMGDQERRTTCAECGLTYFYDPRHHECSTDTRSAAERAEDDRHAETWADECVRRVMAPRPPKKGA